MQGEGAGGAQVPRSVVCELRLQCRDDGGVHDAARHLIGGHAVVVVRLAGDGLVGSEGAVHVALGVVEGVGAVLGICGRHERRVGRTSEGLLDWESHLEEPRFCERLDSILWELECQSAQV